MPESVKILFAYDLRGFIDWVFPNIEYSGHHYKFDGIQFFPAWKRTRSYDL